MRYLTGFVLVLALVSSPARVTAQEHEEDVAPRSPEGEPIDGTRTSKSWLERMYPEALEAPTKKSDSGIEMEYVPVQSEPHAKAGHRKGMSRGGKIAVGVVVPVLVVGIVAGAAVMATGFGDSLWAD